MSKYEQIKIIKGLNTQQYDKAQQSAVNRITAKIGNKPQRSTFAKEYGSLFLPVDYVLPFSFIPAFILSSIHISAHMGELASKSYDTLSQTANGLVIGKDFYVFSHQFFSIPLAEASMLAFLVLFGITYKGWHKYIYLMLAILSIIFVFISNWQANVGLLESILPCAFSVGIGLRADKLIIEYMRRKRETDDRYKEALSIYEIASLDPTKHPDFNVYLKQEIWQAVSKLPSNINYTDVPNGIKSMVVNREIDRINLDDDGETPDDFLQTMNSPLNPKIGGKVESSKEKNAPNAETISTPAKKRGRPAQKIAKINANTELN